MIANTMKLACGAEVPLVGLGLWKIANEDAPRMVEQAIDAGYRHLDSACDYGNEPAVGAGVANVRRRAKSAAASYGSRRSFGTPTTSRNTSARRASDRSAIWGSIISICI